MDDSVVFVRELRRRDSDVIFVEPENSNHVASIPIIPESPVIDVSLESDDIDSEHFEMITTNNFEGHKSNKNIPENQTAKPFNTELKTNKRKTEHFNLKCPICLESMKNLEIKVTKCGHLFCKNCLDRVMEKPEPCCSICRQRLVKKKIRSVYL